MLKELEDLKAVERQWEKKNQAAAEELENANQMVDFFWGKFVAASTTYDNLHTSEVRGLVTKLDGLTSDYARMQSEMDHLLQSENDAPNSVFNSIHSFQFYMLN